MPSPPQSVSFIVATQLRDQGSFRLGETRRFRYALKYPAKWFFSSRCEISRPLSRRIAKTAERRKRPLLSNKTSNIAGVPSVPEGGPARQELSCWLGHRKNDSREPRILLTDHRVCIALTRGLIFTPLHIHERAQTYWIVFFFVQYEVSESDDVQGARADYMADFRSIDSFHATVEMRRLKKAEFLKDEISWNIGYCVVRKCVISIRDSNTNVISLLIDDWGN